MKVYNTRNGNSYNVYSVIKYVYDCIQKYVIMILTVLGQAEINRLSLESTS